MDKRWEQSPLPPNRKLNQQTGKHSLLLHVSNWVFFLRDNPSGPTNKRARHSGARQMSWDGTKSHQEWAHWPHQTEEADPTTPGTKQDASVSSKAKKNRAVKTDRKMPRLHIPNAQAQLLVGRKIQILLSGKFATSRVKPVLGEMEVRSWKAFGQWVNTIRRASLKSVTPAQLAFGVATFSMQILAGTSFRAAMHRFPGEPCARQADGSTSRALGSHPSPQPSRRRDQHSNPD